MECGFFLFLIHKFLAAVAALTYAHLSVLNSLGGTITYTCHAVGAVSLPQNPTVFKGHIIQRAFLRALSAGNAFIRSAELFIGYGVAVKTFVDNSGEQLIFYPRLFLREWLSGRHKLRLFRTAGKGNPH